MSRTDQHKAYWLKQLSDPPPCPKLPWDKERPPVSSFVRETVTKQVSSESWHAIKNFVARTATTTHSALLAALQALLFRYTGQKDLILGSVLGTHSASARNGVVALRSRLTGQDTVQSLVEQVTLSLSEAQKHLELPFSAVVELLGRHSWEPEEALFNVALTYQDQTDSSSTVAAEYAGGAELTACAVVLHARQTHSALELSFEYDAELFEARTIERLSDHFGNLLADIAAQPNATLERLRLLGAAERNQLLVEWNATRTDLPNTVCIHQLIEAQAERTPGHIAVVCRDQQLSYAELNARANQVASYLSKLGVGPDTIVGICVDRSLEMLVGLLGILKAGGAYLPLDPAYPGDRLAFMVEDAKVKVLLTLERLSGVLPEATAPRLRLDADWDAMSREPTETVSRNVDPKHLAYVLYTSGSTGKPKGVMVEHGNVINFFVGMDARVPHDASSTWLAVTSPSFDISVLELFWTLARGIRVVLFGGDEPPRRSLPAGKRSATRPMDFSLFYFSSQQQNGTGGAYRLLTEGARFADENGFAAVWTPERHFHQFGGLFPNPSVASAALAMITRRVQIRAGSVVAPLHSPIRIAEEWSVVDNLSNGRVAVSFASGWNPEDFTVSPSSYAERKDIMFRHLEVVRRLWRGESVHMPGSLGKDVAVRIFPRPVQKELPLWLTAAGNPETFQMAGKLGINVLTHLLGQTMAEVSQKVALYREAWKQAGHDGRGHVTLMLHTFVGESQESVKAIVREPLIDYLRSSADLIKGYGWAFSAFKQRSDPKEKLDFSKLPKEEMDALLEHAFNRYFETSGLFGTPASCVPIIENLRANDVDEVACLIDFGVNPEVVLANLKHLDAVRRATSAGSADEPADYSIPALILRHGVTHLQCTPSMAGMLLLDERTRAGLAGLRTLMVGGEALPAALARQLRRIIRGDILNMYGPTETTVWSTTCQVPEESARVPVGRPIANTQIYVVDQNLEPVPVGVPGEVMIGGAGVARGYLGRSELTVKRFIRDPFRDDGTSRMYRTGDLGRYLPDGNLELLGRMDHQVKIRGHRVELEEIEAVLNEHPGVRESVVIAKESATGDKRLVAYAIAREGAAPTRHQLRQYTQGRLPDFMVPAEIVFMAAFPQTPNQKVDRQALPVPSDNPHEGEDGFELPRTAMEKAVAAVWCELLGVKRVRRDDDFFESGGHSLLAMQFVSRVRERFGVELPLKNLFERPTMAGLAEAIETLSWSVTAKAPAKAAPDREEVVL